MFYIKEYKLLFIDSSGMNPIFYGWDINDFYALYPRRKSMVLSKPVQNEFPYVCGGCCVVIPYLLSKNYTIKRVKSLFTENTRKNDAYATGYLYLLVGISLSCKFCPEIMFVRGCRNYYSCWEK